MFNAIEIPDSDEETNHVESRLLSEERATTPPTTAKSSEAEEQTPEKNTTMNQAKAADISASFSSTTIQTVNLSPTNSTDANLPGTSVGLAAGAVGRHRSRKTKHQALRISPTDIEFGTIDDESEGPSNAKEAKLSEPTTRKQQLIAKLLEDEEVKDVVTRIAEERVRCNFLLETYQLSDMNFLLNTKLEELHQQFQARIKQRKDRINVASKASLAVNSAPAQTNAVSSAGVTVPRTMTVPTGPKTKNT